MKPFWSGFIEGLALPVTAPLAWLRRWIARPLIAEQTRSWSLLLGQTNNEYYQRGYAAGQQAGRDEMFNTLQAYLDDRHGVPDFSYSDLERARKGFLH